MSEYLRVCFCLHTYSLALGFPGGSDGKESACISDAAGAYEVLSMFHSLLSDGDMNIFFTIKLYI